MDTTDGPHISYLSGGVLGLDEAEAGVLVEVGAEVEAREAGGLVSFFWGVDRKSVV